MSYRTLTLNLNENAYNSQFYLSDVDKLLRRIQAEQDLQNFRLNKNKVFKLNVKKTKEQKKEEQRIIREQKKIERNKLKEQKKAEQAALKKLERERQKKEEKKINELFKERQKLLKDIEKTREYRRKKIIREEKKENEKKEKEKLKKELKIKKLAEKQNLKNIILKDDEKLIYILNYIDELKNKNNDIRNFYEFNLNYLPLRAEEEDKFEIYNLFYNIYKKYKETDILFTYIHNGEMKINKQIYLSQETSFQEWWKIFSKYGALIYDGSNYSIDIVEDDLRIIYDENEEIMYNENGEIRYYPISQYNIDFEYNKEYNVYEGKIIIYPIQKNKREETKLLKQMFKEHEISNCLLEPIKNWAIEHIKNSTAKSTYYRYLSIKNKIDKYIDKYLDSGVPENEIINICNDLQIDIDITLPLETDKNIIECKSDKKALKKFTFINTKFNHIEHDNLILKNKFITTTIKEDEVYNLTNKDLYNMKKELDKKNEFYIYKRNDTQITSLLTLNGNYRCVNEYNEIVKNFEIETGLYYCKICDIEDKELSKFIRDGCHYNISLNFVDKINNDKKINHIDMKKAYAAFKHCNYYDGFLGKITDFRKTNKIMGIGLYQIDNIDFSNVEENIKKILLKLNIYHNKFIYTSPELKFLEDNNIKFDIIAGAWGHSPLYFEFNKEMLNNKDNNVSYYAKWTGGINSYRMTDNYYLKSSDEYARILNYYSMCDIHKNISYISETGEALVRIDKKNNYHLSHITSFILSYQRLNLIEQLLEIDYNDVIKINVDCIYYYNNENDINLKNVFRHKEFNNIHLTFCDNSFISTIEDKKYSRNYNYSNIEVNNNYRTKINLGCGGSGKTTKELRDTGLIKKVFCPPSWKLARKKETEENVNVSVWYYITTKDPEILNKILKKYNVLIIDEVSMMTEETKKFIMEKFKLCKIIFCGDLGYQLPPFETKETKEKGLIIKEMTTNNIDVIEYFNNNYRCKCPLLLELLNKCRDMIKNEEPLIYINNWIINFFKKNKKIIKKDNLIKYYDINDMILSSTNEIKDQYTEIFKGKFINKKYYITSNNRYYSNGQIIISNEKIIGVSSDERYCYTTHSIQGETAYDKIFIDINKIFDERMFYTALSRAMYLDQIYLISN